MVSPNWKEEKGDLEGEGCTPYLGLLIALSPFLKHRTSPFKGPKSIKT